MKVKQMKKRAKKKAKKRDLTPGKGIKTKHGNNYPFVPYVFLITMMKDGERKLFIGSKTHDYPIIYSNALLVKHANPNHFIDGDHNGEDTVIDSYISDGWYIIERDVIGKFPGTEEGIKQAHAFEKKMKRKHKVHKSSNFLNMDAKSDSETRKKVWDSARNPSFEEMDRMDEEGADW